MCIEAVNVLDVTLDARGKVKEVNKTKTNSAKNRSKRRYGISVFHSVQAAKYFCKAKVRAQLTEDCKYMMKKNLNRIVNYLKAPFENDALSMCTYIRACGVKQQKGGYSPTREDDYYSFVD
ncbi:hypothetical protein Y032_0143g2426 [Ancylostoma ceylanicum]|uniref:Saposin B-type domain-containing protein n=1 Tax=Ancylostoma ceylanicum TaxID=53326 RepID=A0A016T3K4_9BILA|nr:hypothetical protein Y032_0143g2426 [Ancylostoma ceylanicum]